MSDNEQGRRPRRGRKPKQDGPKGETGLGAVINARVRWETRRALEAEADRTGRSISQVADAWLEAAAAGHASTDGLASATGLRRMIAFARLVESRIGDPVTDRTAWAALRAGMTLLGARVMSDPPIATTEEFDVLLALPDLRARALNLAELMGYEGARVFEAAVATWDLEQKEDWVHHLGELEEALRQASKLAPQHKREAGTIAEGLAALVLLLPPAPERLGRQEGSSMARVLLGEAKPSDTSE